MDAAESKLFRVAAKTKKPVSLAALVVLVLSLIYRLVLNLGVFAPISSHATFVLLDSIVTKVFYLALAALVLGMAAYVATRLLGRVPSKRPPVRPDTQTGLSETHTVEASGPDAVAVGGNVIIHAHDVQMGGSRQTTAAKPEAPEKPEQPRGDILPVPPEPYFGYRYPMPKHWTGREAETHLTEALTRCRRINNVESEPDILLAWARWHRAKGDRAAALAALDALSIADRAEYRLVQADAHNFLAQLALDEGDEKTCRKEAENARERALCDGPPHSYKPALDEADRLLAELKNA